MPFKATNKILASAYLQIKQTASAVKRHAESAKAKLTTEDVSAGYLLDIIDNMISHKATLDSLVSVAGLAAYAKTQEDDPTYDVVTEYQGFTSDMTAVVLWIKNNFPVDGDGYLLFQTFDADGSRISITFSVSQTTVLRNKLDDLIAAVE